MRVTAWIAAAIVVSGCAACGKKEPDDVIAFVSWRTDPPAVFVSDARAKGKVERLTEQRVWSAAPPVWSPDGAKLAFTVETGKDQWSVLVVDLATRESTVAAKNAKAEEWSPTGVLLSTNVVDVDALLQGKKPLRRSLQQIHAVSPDGKHRRISDGVGWDFSPAVSPDGKRVAYVSNRHDAIELRTMAIDGSGHKRLVKSKEEITAPSWSPDGTAVVFECERAGARRICLVPAAGGNPAELTTGAFASSPAWSPDGKHIAFLAKDDEGAPQVWVMDAGGKNAHAITKDGRHASPSWSPDGTRIACSREAARDVEVVVIPADGGKALAVSRDLSRDVYPAWRPRVIAAP